jgi:uncharacterized protein YbaR (Trm112 family)
MIDPELLSLLVCPETKQELEAADKALIERLNARIARGELLNRGGQKVSEKIDAGLVRVGDRKYLYPVRDDIPVMLIEEALPLEG